MGQMKGLKVKHKWQKFYQDEWIKKQGIMGSSNGVCYGLVVMWIARNGGRGFKEFSDSKEAKEEVSFMQGAQKDASVVQTKLRMEGKAILRDGHLYWYPIAEIIRLTMTDPGHFLVGLKKDGKGTGHAIGVSTLMRLSGAEARVFDPNVGEILLYDIADIDATVSHLCTTLYPEYNTGMRVQCVK